MSLTRDEILLYIQTKNIAKIRLACLQSGLGDPDLRRQVWPILLKVEEKKPFLSNWKSTLQDNEYSEIIQRDVNRSLFGLDITETLSEEERLYKRVQLSNIINAVINKNPNLHYFQGFNSICTVFLLVGEEDLGFMMSYQCAEMFIKDSMRKSFEEGVSIEMLLIYKLLEKMDKKLSARLQEIYTVEASLSSPIFSLSWVLTWLSHNIHSFEKLCRVFDFCLASHPLAPVYLAAAIIYTEKYNIMNLSEMPEIHQYFHDLVPHINVDEVCKISMKMMLDFNPLKLVESSQKTFHRE
jgi:TBC1 domain family member 20